MLCSSISRSIPPRINSFYPKAITILNTELKIHSWHVRRTNHVQLYWALSTLFHLNSIINSFLINIFFVIKLFVAGYVGIFIISLYVSTMTIINLNLKTKYRYILKKLNIMKNINIFCHSFQKVNPIYYIDSLHIECNISSLYFLTFWWLWLTDIETPKCSVSESKILHKIN